MLGHFLSFFPLSSLPTARFVSMDTGTIPAIACWFLVRSLMSESLGITRDARKKKGQRVPLILKCSFMRLVTMLFLSLLLDLFSFFLCFMQVMQYAVALFLVVTKADKPNSTSFIYWCTATLMIWRGPLSNFRVC